MANQPKGGLELFDRVVDILSPYIGHATARASVRMFLREIAIEPEQIEARHLDHLAKKLEPGLRVFVGGPTASMLGRRVIRAAPPQEEK